MGSTPYESDWDTLHESRHSTSFPGASVCSKWKPSRAVHGKVVYVVSNGITTIVEFKTRELAEEYIALVNYLKK